MFGPGLLESAYELALCRELTDRRIAFVRQPLFPIIYKGEVVGEQRLDLVVERELVVELKSVESVLPIHKAQVISYLRVTKHHLALLINFNVAVLADGITRIIAS